MRLLSKSGEVAQWQELVNRATHISGIDLGEELESYLVFLLIRYVNKPHFAKNGLALDYLQSDNAYNLAHQEKLQDVGDRCLLFSGLFPGIAERRRVNVSYYVGLGRGAYYRLSQASKPTTAALYQGLSQRFVHLIDVLLATREHADDFSGLTPLQAFEMWDETRSQYAYKILQRCCSGVPIRHRKQ